MCRFSCLYRLQGEWKARLFRERPGCLDRSGLGSVTERGVALLQRDSTQSQTCHARAVTCRHSKVELIEAMTERAEQ